MTTVTGRERSSWEQESYDKGVEAARRLAEALNCTGDKEVIEGFVEELTLRTHRTLQQSAFLAFVGAIKSWANGGQVGFFSAPDGEDTFEWKEI